MLIGHAALLHVFDFGLWGWRVYVVIQHPPDYIQPFVRQLIDQDLEIIAVGHLLDSIARGRGTRKDLIVQGHTYVASVSIGELQRASTETTG